MPLGPFPKTQLIKGLEPDMYAAKYNSDASASNPVTKPKCISHKYEGRGVGKRQVIGTANICSCGRVWGKPM